VTPSGPDQHYDFFLNRGEQQRKKQPQKELLGGIAAQPATTGQSCGEHWKGAS
jgi:hypothetical protein